jgi:anti-anti-sigma factor
MGAAEAQCLRIRDTLQANGLGALSFPVELLARECLANAIDHGNRHADDKSIVLRFAVGRKWIRLQVADEGPGFDWRTGLECETNTTSSSGRGLPLYRLYAERVEFNRSGNRITLWIDRKRAGKEVEEMAAYVIEQKDRHASVTLNGDLTAILVPDLQAGLKETLNRGARELVFDLTDTAMLDSSGIGLLIATANILFHGGRSLRVTNVCPNIFRLLQSMRLTSRLNVSAIAA